MAIKTRNAPAAPIVRPKTAPAPSKAKAATLQQAAKTATRTANSAMPPSGVRGTSEAPHKLHDHLPAPDAAKASKTLTKERLAGSGVDAADKAALKAHKLHNLKEGGWEAASRMTAPQLDAFSAADLSSAAKEWGMKGYSGLKKAELVTFIQQGKKPAPAKDSARDVAERLKAAKADGKVTGPISALTKSQGEKVLAQLATATAPVPVVKPAPKDDSADGMRLRLKKLDIAKVNAFLKTVGDKRTLSSAKVADIKLAIAHFGI